MERHLNRKLSKAIEERWPLWWKYGEYRKYYEGFALHASCGYCENGRQFDSIVFGTSSLKGAQEVRAILDAKGIVAGQWQETLDKYEAEQRRRNPMWRSQR